MKKLMLSLLVGFNVSAQVGHDLFDAIKELDVDRVKIILENKAHSINKAELQRYLLELKDMTKTNMKKLVQTRGVNLPWYERYGDLAKIGLGLVGTGLAIHFWNQAIEQNPEPGVGICKLVGRFFTAEPSVNPLDHSSRSINAPLCIASGAVGALSIHSVITGALRLTKYRNSLKVYTIRELIKKAVETTI